jgi:hypothetical protein
MQVKGSAMDPVFAHRGPQNTPERACSAGKLSRAAD